MAVDSVAIKCDSFNKNIYIGFSELQQREEFVDMTLAAGGCQVKVHQNVIALASPYLKSLLQSAACKHPIIFLNKISSETLGYILEYIYTGEVVIPTNKIQPFLDASSELHITSVKNITMPELNSAESQDVVKDPNEKQIGDSDGSNPEILTRTLRSKKRKKILQKTDTLLNVNEEEKSNIENFIPNTNISLNEWEENIVLGQNLNEVIDTVSSQNIVETVNQIPSDNFVSQKIINITPEATSNVDYNLDCNSKQNPSLFLEPLIPTQSQPLEDDYDSELPVNFISRDEVTTSIVIKNTDFGNYQLEVSQCKKDGSNENSTEPSEAANFALQHTNEFNDADKAISSIPRYTFSNRGSMQLLLNGFMYSAHHQSNLGRNIRWRCVDYRRKRCPVFIDTRGEIFVARKFAHKHPNHENRILKKMLCGVFYDSIDSLIGKKT